MNLDNYRIIGDSVYEHDFQGICRHIKKLKWWERLIGGFMSERKLKEFLLKNSVKKGNGKEKLLLENQRLKEKLTRMKLLEQSLTELQRRSFELENKYNRLKLEKGKNIYTKNVADRLDFLESRIDGDLAKEYDKLFFNEEEESTKSETSLGEFMEQIRRMESSTRYRGYTYVGAIPVVERTS